MAQQRQGKHRIAVFERGTLRDRLRATTAQALRDGALQSIETESVVVEDRGISFLVRIVSNLRYKPAGSDERNPFLPYEQALYIADASSTHVCILNKYNVVDLHLLIITRDFEHQETLLTQGDFLALGRCLAEFDSLGFYNSGTISGASQKHKHLQLVPLPMVAGVDCPAVPLEPLIGTTAARPNEITHSPTLPFAHALIRWTAPPMGHLDQWAARSLAVYRNMLRHVGIAVPAEENQLLARPYNLLVTRRWMLLVPRLYECFESISFNALAFAGALLLPDAKSLRLLRRAGPFAALQHVAPRGP